MNEDSRMVTKSVVNAELIQPNGAVHKLHPEISNALKRQRETSGIDYWKTPSNIKSTDTASNVKRTGKLHSLHFEFPDVGLPIITHRLSKHPNMMPQNKAKKKTVAPGFDVLSRSHSSINLSTHNSQDKCRNAEFSVPNKASVTDLTCLQFADTLLSHSTPRRTGLYGFTVGKVKYMDFLEENINNSDKPRSKETGTRDNSNDKSNKDLKIVKTANSKMLPSIQKLDPKSSKPKQVNKYTTSQNIKAEQKEIQQTADLNKTSGNPHNPLQGDDGLKQSNRKSILKQTVTTECEKDKTLQEKENIAKHKQEPTKPTKITINECVKRKECDVFDPSLCVTITASPPRHRKGFTSCSMSARTDRRSVRFNKSDEVFEFTPSEPICY